jgi:hypothetical protein
MYLVSDVHAVGISTDKASVHSELMVVTKEFGDSECHLSHLTTNNCHKSNAIVKL